MPGDDSAERAVLLGRLGGQRRHVLSQLESLTDEQLRRPVLPSGWSCLGLVRHLTLSDERYWFDVVVAGEPLDFWPVGENGDWRVGPEEPAEGVLEGYRVRRPVRVRRIGPAVRPSTASRTARSTGMGSGMSAGLAPLPSTFMSAARHLALGGAHSRVLPLLEVVVKRVICLLLGHNWSRHRYPAARPGDDAPEGSYLKCVRCSKVDESEGLPSGPMVAGF